MSANLWEAAHRRLAARRAVHLHATGRGSGDRPSNGIVSRYLLVGFAECGLCHGSLEVRSRVSGNHRRYVYACATYHRRGRTVCPNGLLAPMREIDAAVVACLDGVLDQDLLRDAARLALDQLHPTGNPASEPRAALLEELRRLDDERGRLAPAIAAGGQLKPLLALLQERERRRAVLEAETTAAGWDKTPNEIERRHVLQELEAILAGWRKLLTSQAEPAREVLRQLLQGRLVFNPRRSAEGACYTFEGTGSLAGLFAGIVRSQDLVSPTGHATSALVTRVYLVVQAYAALRFRPWGRWQVKSGPSG